MPVSQNGWPVMSGYSDPDLHRWVISEADTILALREGCGGFVLAHCAGRFDKKVETLKEPVLDDWGVAIRAVRGWAATYSNHASATAMDLNATDHGLGRINTFTKAEMAAIDKILKKYEGCIRWGGDYKGRKDEMHFELDRGIAEVNKLAIKLMDTPYGKKLLADNPGQKRIILAA